MATSSCVRSCNIPSRDIDGSRTQAFDTMAQCLPKYKGWQSVPRLSWQWIKMALITIKLIVNNFQVEIILVEYRG